MKLLNKYIALTLALLLAGTFAFAQGSTDEQLADQYFQNREYDKAVVLYEKLYKKNENIYRNYINCLIALENFDEAEKIIKKKLKKNEGQLGLLIDLGTVYHNAGERKKAEQQYNEVIKNLPPNDGDIRAVANTFIGLQEFDFALKTYEKGKRIMAGMYSFNFEMADVYAYKKDIPAMFKEYLDAISQNEANLPKVEEVLQTSLSDDASGKKNELLEGLLIDRIQNNPDRKVFAELLIWHMIQRQNFEGAFIQAKAMDKRLKEDGSRLIELANISTANKEYDIAAKCYQYVIKKGRDNYFYLSAKMSLVDVMNKKIVEQNEYTQEDLEELRQTYVSTIDELGKDRNTVKLLRGYAHLLAFYLHNTQEAIDILNETLAISYISRQDEAETKIELGDVYLLSGEMWEPQLLYSQAEKMFKNEPLGHTAKLKNAKLSFYKGEFEWSRAQLNILKSATSQLIANDALYLSLLISDNTVMDTTFTALQMFARADLLFFQNKDDEALVTLDSVNDMFPGHSLADDILYKKAQIMVKRQDYEKASEFLQQVVDGFGYEILGDDALFMLADITENKFDDDAKAMQLYQDLLINYPGSLYTVEARKRFRKLRGDQIN